MSQASRRNTIARSAAGPGSGIDGRSISSVAFDDARPRPLTRCWVAKVRDKDVGAVVFRQ